MQGFEKNSHPRVNDHLSEFSGNYGIMRFCGWMLNSAEIKYDAKNVERRLYSK